MLTRISNEKNNSLILELSEGQDVGTIGGYCEDGFPIYYANDKIAHMLGYNDVEDLIEGIQGKVSNTIHPDDMDRVVRELNNGNFYEGMTYKVTYRMPKKDGSAIWTVDKGKVVRAEDGRLAILSICNDMTEFIDRHSELERLNKLSQSTLENMPGGYHRCAAEEGFPFLYISDRFCEMFGWTREEISTEFDNKFINMLHPDDVETSMDYVGRLENNSDTNVIDAIYRMRGKNGYIWVSDATSLVTVGNESFYQGTLTDISDFIDKRKNLDDMREIFAASRMGSWSIYLGDGKQPRMVADDLMLDLLGIGNDSLTPEQVYERWFSNIHPDAVQSVLDSVEKMKKTGRDENTYLWIHPTLGERYVRCGGTAKAKDGGYVLRGYHYDVDETVREQKRKDQALTEQIEIINALSKSFRNVFVANLRDGMARVIRLDGSYKVKAVRDVAEMTFPFDAVVEKWVQETVHPDDKEKIRKTVNMENMRKVFSKQEQFIGTYRNVEDGVQHYYQFDFRRVGDTDNVVAGFQIIDTIVEEQEARLQEQKEHQEALSNALAAAKQANKAKTTFLNSMSHDIRTPMNAIIGFTALAQTHIDDKAQVEDYLSKISTSSTHLLSLINDILDMSRIESGTVKLEEKTVHIPDLLHDLRTMIQGLVNSKNLNLFIDTQDVTHEDVLTDKLRLNQVLLNIVSNAVKFTQPGGDIIIRLIEKPCRARHYTTYEFSVKDNGIGMSQEFQEHIFETFTREYSSTVSGIQGTGLGMAITKNIVDMMGGDIKVESQEGKGSIFTVTLNLRLANEPIKYEPIPELLGARVLVVDDDMNTCRSVSKMLRDIQMRPDWTASGKEAIVRAQDAADMQDEYKVYIIDYLMPDMNGIETVRRIRKVISEDVPIIVLTAYDWADFEYEAREAGVTAFVSKPIFMSEMREVLTQPVVSEGLAKKEENKKVYDYSGKRVLLAEDNELNREIATAILEETGMIIDSVCDGDEAVAAINNSSAGKYDLILMDIQMPKMDGYTATREIRTLADNEKANIPIVAMTANAFEEDRRMAYEAGMNGHIIKPISIEAIAKVLDEIFEKN